MNIIDRFTIGDDHSPLSNFYPSEFYAPHWAGGDLRRWKTAEHYYQAAKATKKADIDRIERQLKPGQAKRVGRLVKPMCPNWDYIRLEVMREALKLKFVADPESDLTQYLLSTGDAVLVEGNTWGDDFWGCVKTEEGLFKDGKNWLGTLLMARRAVLREMLSNYSGTLF